MGLMDWERDLFDRFVTPGATVLVIGAGTGRDVIPLVERGCRSPASSPRPHRSRSRAGSSRHEGFRRR